MEIHYHVKCFCEKRKTKMARKKKKKEVLSAMVKRDIESG